MSINLWVVILAAVVGMFIGALWYSQALFGKSWAALSGVSMETMKGMGGKGYLAGFIAQLITAYVLAYFVIRFGAGDFGSGFGLAFIGWLGFTAPELFGRVLWEGRPMKLFLINAGHWLVGLGVMGGILATML